MEYGLRRLGGEEDDLTDTSCLRKNMFICHNEREEYMHQARMKRMRWDRRRSDVGSNCYANHDGVSQSLNPALRNVDILEKIAIHLSTEDMLSCRLVCKHWKSEMAILLFKRKSLIVIKEDCPVAKNLLEKRLNGNPTTLSKLSLFKVDSNCDLFHKLFAVFGTTLSSVSLEDCKLTPKDLYRMLLIESPNIESLHFREGEKPRNPRISTFKEIKMLNDNQMYLPKLKILHWDEESGQTGLKELLDACPNLIMLELRNFPVPRSNSFKEHTWEHLTSLFLSPRNCFTAEHSKALSHLQLKLKKLTLFGINSGDGSAMRSLSVFLATLANTLEILELWLDYASLLSEPRTASYSPFAAVLPNVKRLQTESEIVGHINHLDRFPSLCELEVVSNTFEGQNWSQLTRRAIIQNHSTLKSLRCGDIDYKSFSKMMKAFPCITTLHVYATHVNDTFLRSIIKNLSGLTDLTISPCLKSAPLRLTDSGITGVSAEVCRMVHQTPNEFKNVDINGMKTQPGISDLKQLTKLDLSLQNCEITDASVISIATLPKLCSLKLPLCKVTDVGLNILEEKLTKLIVLGISGCRNITQEAVDGLKLRKSSLYIERDLSPIIENMIINS